MHTFSVVRVFLTYRYLLPSKSLFSFLFLMIHPCLNCHVISLNITYISQSFHFPTDGHLNFHLLLLYEVCLPVGLLGHTCKRLGRHMLAHTVGVLLFAKLCRFAPLLAVMSSLCSTFSPTVDMVRRVHFLPL